MIPALRASNGLWQSVGVGRHTILWLQAGALIAGLAACAVRSPDVGKDGAAAAVARHLASVEDVDPAEYDVTVTEQVGGDGKRYYYVRWSVKQDPARGWVVGGLMAYWVDPATGDVVRGDWYQ